MIKKFIAYIKKEKLFTAKDKLLVAVSGGMDSMALCGLLKEGGFDFSVAHCNFKLRGKESDEDELFVKRYCKENSIRFFSKPFDTTGYAKEKKLSVQMAARDLRYAWFDELMKHHCFDYLLTAHHLNDNIETFFINLLRGSGINGLKGILPKKDKKVRPLLFATRKEIEEYIKKNKIAYREDSSNREDKYLRNQLRHHIIPELKKINPAFEEIFAAELEVLQQVNQVIVSETEKHKKNILLIKGGIVKLNIDKLKKTTSPKLFLFEILKDYGFNTSRVNNIYASLNGLSGKVFESTTHQVIKDRDFLLIQKIETKTEEEFTIVQTTKHITHPFKLSISFSALKAGSNAVIPPSKNSICLDADKLHFPLLLTKWKAGDAFHPLGMKGSKKLSDFFVSQKMSLPEKEDQWILRSGKDIVWVVGKRIDDRFKIMEETKRICRMEFENLMTGRTDGQVW